MGSPPGMIEPNTLLLVGGDSPLSPTVLDITAHFPRVLRNIMTEEGEGALYRGTAPVMLLAFPANAACCFGSDAAKAFFRSLEH